MKKYQLPKEFAEKWVEALRTTTEEKHHHGRLRHPANIDCFCGIGIGMVANNIVISDDGVAIIIDSKTTDYFNSFIFEYALVCDFVVKNDQERLTFFELSDWLEENVEFI
jgi:hypothetical protein